MSEREKQLEWALVRIMDGVKAHEIVAMIGCNQEDAQRIYQIAQDAISAREVRYGKDQSEQLS